MLLPVLAGICGSGFGAELTEVVLAQGLSCVFGQTVCAAATAGG